MIGAPSLSFNSTTVQLIHMSFCILKLPNKFQFHNGTINTNVSPFVIGIDMKFQFHNGTINTIFPCLASIAKILFQFHNGTINTLHVPLCGWNPFLFQFHNGTINTFPSTFFFLILSCFNSTTVQLILLPTNHLTHKTSFQFHNGTINTARLTQEKSPINEFQFHNGTINTLTNTQKKQLKMSELANNKYAFYMINYVDG